MVEITFLGSGGGRFITITQLRSTGGFFIKSSKNIYVDPGPGALVRAWRYKIDPRKIDILFISHRHTDHCNDAEVIVEGMTMGVTKKRGAIIAARSVIEGDEEHTPALSSYHLNSLEEVYTPKPGDKISLGNDTLLITPSLHSDPSNIGFRLKTPEGDISYISDTQYFEELKEWHEGARVMITSITRPKDMRIPYHLCTEDVIYLLKSMKEKPEVVVMTHIGMKMHFASPYKEASFIQNVTGVKTIVAKEGFKIIMRNNDIFFRTLKPARNV